MKRKPIRDWDASAPLPPRSGKRANMSGGEAVRQEKVKRIERTEEEDRALPPRGVAHPSEKRKWNTLYYRVLLLLFIGLTAGLLYWGFQLFPS